ncbi:astacin-like metalloendopeptidase [Babylonia areolata]|uniref:astacin-like metalloendopeptidase n=1 Tax=Babylonia areolata TaxID=304850 RepID=UPI003FD4764E
MGKCVDHEVLVLLLFLITLFTGCSSSCSTETLLTADRLYSRTLRSPNYPSNYSNNKECVWRIRAESWRFTVRLYVADISLENDHDCTFDSLSFYDGGLASNDNLLAKLCGNSGLNSYFYSSGREILVKFKSDSSDTCRGFRLLYKSGVSQRYPQPPPLQLLITTGRQVTTAKNHFPHC